MSSVHKSEVVPSFLPPAWGGPFVWIRNAAGRLVLHSIPKLTGEAKAVVEAITGGTR